MLNLYERLKSDYALALEEERAIDPSKVESIEKVLSNELFISEIRYGTVVQLYWICYRAGLPFDMTNTWEIFEDHK